MEAGGEFGALAADVFGGGTEFARALKSVGENAKLGDTKPVGRGGIERGVGVGGERDLGVAKSRERGEEEKGAQGFAVVNDAKFDQAFEAEGVSVASGRVEGIACLKETDEPRGISICGWDRDHRREG